MPWKAATDSPIDHKVILSLPSTSRLNTRATSRPFQASVYSCFSLVEDWAVPDEESYLSPLGASSVRCRTGFDGGRIDLKLGGALNFVGEATAGGRW